MLQRDPKPKVANAADAQIGMRVRSIRLAQGVSQEMLGKKLGITFQQVQKYEKGTNRIGAARLMEIAKILNTSYGELVGADGTEVADNVFDHRAHAMAQSFKRLYDLLPSAGKHVRTMVEAICGDIEAERRKKKQR